MTQDLIYFPGDGLWKDIERPGYIGKHKAEIQQQWDIEYGEGNWRLAWRYGNVYLTFLGACALYEAAYQAYVSSNPDKMLELITIASNVYDIQEDDRLSGTDYLIQNAPATHIQDIVLRRAIIMEGFWFTGDKLVRVRTNDSNHPLGFFFSPGKVPFYSGKIALPNTIHYGEYPALEGWWDKGSVEEWYQSTRWLQRRIR